MNPTSKKVIAVVVSIAILSIAYYGSYRPLRKAQSFIATLQSLQSSPASSLTDLENRLSVPLDYASPIGQEELVRNAANSVLTFVQNSQNATATVELVNYITSYYNPIISQGKGMSFGQDLYLMGAINELSFAHTGIVGFLQAAQTYYEEANQLGPDRPQALYGLFDVYRAEGNVPKATAVAQHILKNWPGDQNVQAALAAFLTQAAKAPTGTKGK